MPSRPPRSAFSRWALALVLAGAAAWSGAIGCSRNETAAKATAPAPTVDDALRAAQAAKDPIINSSPKTFTFGPIEQHPYLCGTPEPCQPREGRVSRFIGGETVSRTDLAKYFVNNLSIRNWLVEGVYCQPDKEQFVVLASKKADLAKGYPGRFELLAFDKIEARITIPAFGSEASFSLKPAATEYPAGECPAVLAEAFAAAREADGKPVTSVPPGTTPT